MKRARALTFYILPLLKLGTENIIFIFEKGDKDKLYIHIGK